MNAIIGPGAAGTAGQLGLTPLNSMSLRDQAYALLKNAIADTDIYDPKQEVSYLRDFMIFFKPGDIVKFKPVGRDGYDAAIEEVERGRFEPPIRPVTFSLDGFHADPASTNATILGALHGA